MNEVIISFVDVGQGDCTIAMDVSTATAILIDCPVRQHQAALNEIEARNCIFLGAAIITHSHADHSGGVLDVLETLDDRFYGKIYFNRDSFKATPVAGPDRGVAGKQLRAILNRIREFGDRVDHAEARIGGSFGEISWQILAPEYYEVNEAVSIGDPNYASAIVLLSAHNSHVLVGSDAPLKIWERIADQVPIGAICRWPHHGGAIDTTGSLESQEKLFAMVRPSSVVISVGTGNNHGHPSNAFFHARRESRVKLLCTEATSACVLGGGIGGRCAGSIHVSITGSGSKISVDAANHQAIINAFGAAQCK
jgi:competence protein ComEC